MHAIARAGAAAIFCLLCVGCTALSPSDRYEPEPLVVEGLVIRNQLGYSVTDVMIEVPATGGFAGCGNIYARTACSTSFQEVEYRENPILVRWREHGELHQTGEFTVEFSEAPLAGESYWLEVIIFAPGQAGAQLISP